ncbi:pyruvate decarboxylase [Lasius niger]|uniref:2-hydroxyacyl-CoA lyase 2 n=1 Tax=Lasius niger TaxID=67767 RepID=A0A0J7KM68_LASNI|nr:pyruvate decarboxylase [Lasius niger]
MSYTVGQYLADRLVQIGLKDHFAIAGDYNLVLLDQFLKNKNWNQIYDCNELNCGFAAEGYARANGAAACVVTYTVGAISAMNSALAGAYAENLPVLCISGAPNCNDYGSGRILHHTIGKPEFTQQLDMVKHVTCAAESVVQASEAPAKIDHVIRTMLLEQRPAYIDIACNISGLECPRPGPIEDLLPQYAADNKSLTSAIDAIAKKIEASQKVTLYVGPKVRPGKAKEASVKLADALGCAVTVGPASMSFFPAKHPGFRGTYWGIVSTGDANKVVEEAETLIVLGPNWNDYATVGWKAWPKGPRVVTIDEKAAQVDGQVFSGLSMKALVEGLAKKVSKKPATAEGTKAPHFEYPVAKPDAKLTNAEMARQINAILDDNTTLHAETGDSWFNVKNMNWPNGLRIESEMQYGHIGWSIPSGFGGAIGSPERKHIIMCGDGSFQLTCQEVSQMIRYKLPVTIFLIDNHGYGIEIAIHDGPYNYIQNWNFTKLMEVFNGEGEECPYSHNKNGKSGLGLKATTPAELADAIKQAEANKEGPTLIQVVIDQDDCTKDLLTWGKEVAKTNARSPVVTDKA